VDEDRMAAVMLSRKGAFDNTLFEGGVGGFVLYHNFFTGLLDFTSRIP